MCFLYISLIFQVDGWVDVTNTMSMKIDNKVDNYKWTCSFNSNAASKVYKVLFSSKVPNITTYLIVFI